MLGKTFGMELVEVHPRPVPVLEKKDKSSKNGKEPQTQKSTRDAETSSAASASEGEGEGRKKSKKKSSEPKKGPAKMFALRTLMTDSMIRKALEPIEREGDDDEGRLNSDVVGAMGIAAPEELKNWKRGNDAVIDWQTGPDQRALMGVLFVVLALILVNERVLTDGRCSPHGQRLPD